MTPLDQITAAIAYLREPLQRSDEVEDARRVILDGAERMVAVVMAALTINWGNRHLPSCLGVARRFVCQCGVKEIVSALLPLTTELKP